MGRLTLQVANTTHGTRASNVTTIIKLSRRRAFGASFCSKQVSFEEGMCGKVWGRSQKSCFKRYPRVHMRVSHIECMGSP